MHTHSTINALLLFMINYTCRECFLPMSELSNLKQFSTYINQIFPGGALFLVCSDTEFKRLFMDLTRACLEQEDRRHVTAVEVVGRNVLRDGYEAWVLSPTCTIDSRGHLLDPSTSRIVWIPNAESLSHLSCQVKTPFDDGSCLRALYSAAEAFMPDNSLPCLATMACCVMGATYQPVIRQCGHIGVPFLFGSHGSCKTEALMSGLSLFGAHGTHLFNSQTTPSFLFDMLKRTTIPVAVDDVSEKAQDTWEELIIDAYNNTARGTRSYSVEKFSTLPCISANWHFTSTKGRAFTRCITIPFVDHRDEPNASNLYSNLVQARSAASASAGLIINCCTNFTLPASQEKLNNELFPTISTIFGSSHARFKSTMSVFMYFLLEVCIATIMHLLYSEVRKDKQH